MSMFGTVANWWDLFWNRRSWTPIGGMGPTTSMEPVSEESALNCAAVHCATRLLCGTGASLPLPLYSGRDNDTRTKERTHKAFRLLNGSPNPEQTAYNFRSLLWQWQVNWGNGYAEIEREGNDPNGDLVALWPLHPSRVEIQYDNAENLVYKVRNERREPSYLPPWKMFHVPSIITYDGITGHGVIAHARETIGAAIAQEKFGANLFGRGAMPSIVIEKEGPPWSDEARAAFRKEWHEIYSGADGERLALLEGGAKAKSLGLNLVDAQFVEGSNLYVEQIARWYGIPPHLLQQLLRATFNNIEHLGINFVQYSLISWLRIWEQTIWHKLLRPDEQDTMFAEHNVDALLRGDHAARAQFYQTMTNAALMTRNECRRLENLDAVDGGDTFLVQGAMVPLDEDGKPESKFAETGSSVTQQSVAPETDDEDVLSAEAIAAVTHKISRKIEHDLKRFLTKETKAMANFAKKPHEFVQLVDSFYSEHTAMVRDDVIETCGALTLCGVKLDVETFVASWVDDGKNMMLTASGTATPSELQNAIQQVVESRTWTERPIRAVEIIR